MVIFLAWSVPLLYRLSLWLCLGVHLDLFAIMSRVTYSAYRYFPLKHKLHLFEERLYAIARWSKSSIFIQKFVSVSFRFHYVCWAVCLLRRFTLPSKMIVSIDIIPVETYFQIHYWHKNRIYRDSIKSIQPEQKNKFKATNMYTLSKQWLLVLVHNLY